MAPPSSCLTVAAVPEQYRERYICNGYRQPYSSFTTSITSVFRLNNETANFWTHFLPFLVCTSYSLATFPYPFLQLSSVHQRFYPLIAVEASISVYLLFSCVAHLFNCMTPRVRHVCFFFDYAAISVFGIGGACSVYYYQRPENSEFIFKYIDSPNIFMALSAITSCMACIFNCATRHHWDSQKYILRTAAFASVFCINHIATGERMFMCAFRGQDCSSGIFYTFWLWIFYILSAIFNGGRIPERFKPGRYDYLGHSHNWVHVLTTLGTFCHLQAVLLDMEERKNIMLLDRITFTSSIGWVLLTTILCVLIVIWFGSRLTPSGNLKSQKGNKVN